MATWREDIIKALKNLGGQAHLSEIYKEVKNIRGENLNPTFDRTIQRELETHSSDSEAFIGGDSNDIFSIAEGKGKGVWALRDNAKTDFKFGHIKGIDVGAIFNSREELAKANIHKRTIHGIWGREKEGACSIVLSGGYEDDIDELDYIYYTGEGGQDVQGGKQVSNQEFIRGNKALAISCDYNLPVRVTRGFQIPYGPEKGYRYDGIYYVKSYERVIGKNGFYICRFILVSEKNFSDLENKIKNNTKKDYKTPDRKSSTINKINRNPQIGESIKSLYEFKCQVCNNLLLGHDSPIAIGAHIKDLGRPHNGPDTEENVLCLCPNHHALFDRYGFYIDPDTLEIKDLNEDLINNKKKKLTVKAKHKIEKEFLLYKYEVYKKHKKIE
jgi:putative restriction endonuclease